MKKIIFSISTFAFIFAGCTSDYEDINTNVYGASEKDIKQENLTYGAPFSRMQQLVIPIGSPTRTTDPGNRLQNTDLISSGTYIGYFGNNNDWNKVIEATWAFPDNRMSYAYENLYSNFFAEWLEMKRAVGENPTELKDKRTFALAQIMKVAAWLRATDVFGPIVYKNAGNGDVTPSLDSQEDVYRYMLADLEQAVSVLNGGSVLLEEYDVIYNGNIPQWIKFANSLMLRIAVRTHFKDKALATEYAQKALAGGVMTSVNDEAKIQNSSKLPLKNSMMPSVDEYNETRMGLTMEVYLKGYQDPRLPKYFTEGTFNGKKGYYGVVPSNKFQKATGADSPEFASRPNINNDSPLYWMRTSEVLFLQAEAALYGLINGDAQRFYEDGIKMSFQENGITDARLAEQYLQRTQIPENYDSYPYYEIHWWYGYSYAYDISQGNVSPKWDDLRNHDAQEERLQKIITQKYLAMYPNAIEAWTEYRRTGYPLVMKYSDEKSPQRINCPTCFVPERFKYSAEEYSGNPKMIKEVPALLQGENTGGTKLWWVRPNRPQQK